MYSIFIKAASRILAFGLNMNWCYRPIEDGRFSFAV